MQDSSNALTKRLLGLIVAVLAVAMMTATPSFASTAQYSISDAKWDQVSYGSKPSLVQKKQADIVRVTYGRGPARVRTRIRMRDLTRHVRLPRIYFHGERRGYNQQWYPGIGAHPELLNPSRQEICSGEGNLKVNYSANFMQIGFPRSCFPQGYLMHTPAADPSYTDAAHTMEIDDTTGPGHSFHPNP